MPVAVAALRRAPCESGHLRWASHEGFGRPTRPHLTPPVSLPSTARLSTNGEPDGRDRGEKSRLPGLTGNPIPAVKAKRLRGSRIRLAPVMSPYGPRMPLHAGGMWVSRHPPHANCW